MSEADNALSKPCPVCERARILRSMDLCTGCAEAAADEARRDTEAIERFLARQGAFDAWCADHGLPNPHED